MQVIYLTVTMARVIERNTDLPMSRIKVSRYYDTRLPCTCNFISGRPQIFRALSGLPAPARRRFKSPIIFLFRCDKHKRNFFVYFLN